MRRISLLLIIALLLIPVFVLGCGQTVVVPPTTTPTAPPHVGVDAYLPNSTATPVPPLSATENSASAEKDLSGNLGKSYIISIIAQGTDSITGMTALRIFNDETRTSCDSHGICTTQAALNLCGQATDPNSGGNAPTTLDSACQIDLAKESQSWASVELDITVTAVNSHSMETVSKDILIVWT